MQTTRERRYDSCSLAPPASEALESNMVPPTHQTTLQPPMALLGGREGGGGIMREKD